MAKALVLAIAMFALGGAATARANVAPVPIERGVSEAFRVCMLGLTGRVPSGPGSEDALAKLNLLEGVPNAPAGQDYMVPLNLPGGAVLFSRPVTSGKVMIGIGAQRPACRFVAFDQAGSPARSTLLQELANAKTWKKTTDENKAGIHMTSYELAAGNGLKLLANVSWPEPDQKPGEDMRLLVTLVPTKD